jgi:hypothetical protein
MYNMSKEQRKELGKRGYEHVRKNFSYNKFVEFWPQLLDNVHAECGSWPNKNYKDFQFIAI